MRSDALAKHLVERWLDNLSNKPEFAATFEAMSDDDRNDWAETLAMSTARMLTDSEQQNAAYTPAAVEIEDAEEAERLEEERKRAEEEAFVGASERNDALIEDEDLEDLAEKGASQKEGTQQMTSKDRFGGQGGDGPAEPPLHNRMPGGGSGGSGMPRTDAEMGAMARGEDPKNLASGSAGAESQLNAPGHAPTTVRSTQVGGTDVRAKQFGETDEQHRERLAKMDQGGVGGANMTADIERRRQEWLQNPDNQGKPMPDFQTEDPNIRNQRTGGAGQPHGADPTRPETQR